MNGPGYQCDSCGKTVILRQEVGRYSVDGQLPPGWLALSGPDPGTREVFTERHEFCSIGCVATFTHRKIEAAAQEVPS